MDLSWMFWTWQTAAFFIGLALALTVMTVWDARSPSVRTKGFLPLAFTRGERFFISVVLFIGVMLLWLAFTDASPWYAVGLGLVLDFVVARYG